MYIQPNTVIRILKNVPLDKTYEHTIYFSDVSSQITYFSSKAKHVLSNQTYQRVKKGVARVQLNAESLYDCNYMMFQNTSFGSKWFYAFITAIEYVNDVTSDVFFDIDVMQTWFFDYTPNQCFVQREHSITDVIGDNLVPENLEIGDYISENSIQFGSGAKTYVLVTSKNMSGQIYGPYGGNIYGGLYSGLQLTPYTSWNSLSAKVFDISERGEGESIVGIYTMDSSFVCDAGTEESKSYNRSVNKFTDIKDLNGNSPKNNKLYTYPYNLLYVTNDAGSSGVYHYEYFNGDTCEFEEFGDMSVNPSKCIVPKKYKGAEYNWDEKMVLSGYPDVSFNTSTFATWKAQNGLALGIGALTTAVSVGASIATGGATVPETGLSTVANIGTSESLGVSFTPNTKNIGNFTTTANAVKPFAGHSIMPPHSRGNTNSTLMFVLDRLDFSYYQKHIRPEFVSIIDEYFTKYGYATNRLKRPNRSSRPHWNYVKTVGATITGSVPADDMKSICAIYDNGITFWKNGNEVGNYSLNNSPA